MTESIRSAAARREPVRKAFMSRAEVAWELGISLRTLARAIKADPSFPEFVQLTAGVFVVAREDFDAWLQAKLARSRAARILGTN